MSAVSMLGKAHSGSLDTQIMLVNRGKYRFVLCWHDKPDCVVTVQCNEVNLGNFRCSPGELIDWLLGSIKTGQLDRQLSDLS